MTPTIENLKHQIRQLDELHASGALGDAAHTEARARLERQLIDEVLAGHGPGPSADVARQGAAAAPPSAAPPSMKLIVALGLGVFALAAAGYWWQGSPRRLMEGGDASAASGPSAAASASHATSFEQISAMAEKLALRLKDQPDDADGWAMLGRSYAMLGRNADAVPAYQRALQLHGEDARLLADYADALAIKNGRKLDGEPIEMVRKALKLEPDNIKALSLAGTEAFDRKDYIGALKHWDRIARVGPPDSEMVQQIRGSIAEARELAGLPPAPAAPSAASTGAVSPSTVSGGNAQGAAVSGTVTLAAALAKQTLPTDTVFVFARAAQGSPMPLAILRKQVKDLPLDFRLDDSLAMSPAARLSSSPQVLVGARITRSGDALAQPGDLLAQPMPAKLGATGLKLEIAGVVPPK